MLRLESDGTFPVFCVSFACTHPNTLYFGGFQTCISSHVTNVSFATYKLSLCIHLIFQDLWFPQGTQQRLYCSIWDVKPGILAS